MLNKILLLVFSIDSVLFFAYLIALAPVSLACYQLQFFFETDSSDELLLCIGLEL